METLCETVEVLQDRAALHKCGFTLGGDVSQLDPAEAAIEDANAADLHRLVVCVLGHRAQSMLMHGTYPMSFAGLLHCDADVVDAFLWHCEDDWGVLSDLKDRAQGSSFLATLVQRNAVLSTQASQHIMGMLRRDSFRTVSADVKEVLEHIFAGFGQTKVVEDSFKELRERESGDVGSMYKTGVRRLKPSSAWQCIVGSKVLAKHKRAEIEREPGIIAEGMPRTCPPSMFEGSKHKSPIAKGVTQHARWPSFTAQSAAVLIGDLPLLRACRDRDSWQWVERCWFCQLLLPGDVLIETATGRVVVVLGNVITAALVWPVEELQVGVLTFYVLSACSNCRELLQVVLHPDDVKLIPTVARSPQFLQQHGHVGPAVALQQIGDAQALLEALALRAFEGVDGLLLPRLTQYLGLPKGIGRRTHQAQKMALMTALLPNLSQDQLRQKAHEA